MTKSYPFARQGDGAKGGSERGRICKVCETKLLVKKMQEKIFFRLQHKDDYFQHLAGEIEKTVREFNAATALLEQTRNQVQEKEEDHQRVLEEFSAKFQTKTARIQQIESEYEACVAKHYKKLKDLEANRIEMEKLLKEVDLREEQLEKLEEKHRIYAQDLGEI